MFDRKRTTVQSFQNFAAGGEMPGWPAEIFLELSNVCDLKCAMCPTFSALNPNRLIALKEDERGFLDTKVVARPLEELLTHALNVHCFGYGEPTLHPEFRETIEYLSGFEVMIDFFTNGMHIDEDLADFLVRSKVYKVTVSFSGTTREDYENVYLDGRFDKVLAGLRHLAEAKKRQGRLYPIVVINSIAFQHHVDRLDEFIELMAGHGVDYVEVKPLIEHAEMIPELRGHTAVARPDVIARAETLARERGVGLKLYGLGEGAAATEPLPPPVPVAKFREASRSIELVRPKPGRPQHILPTDLEMRKGGDGFSCMEPFKTLYVRRSGETKPCCFASGPSLGSVAAEDGTAIWHGERFTTIREGILSGAYPMALCGNCLKYKTAPAHHSIPGLWGGYLYWRRISFGAADGEEIHLPDNDGIARVWLARHPDRHVEAAPDLKVEGYLDYLTRSRAAGWVWTPTTPGRRFEVALRFRGEILLRAPAETFRQDLIDAGKGDGRYHYDLNLPMPLPDDADPSEVEILAEDTGFVMSRPIGWN